MCFKKIRIKTGTSYPEELNEEFIRQISKDFTIYVTPFSSNKKLLIKAGAICQCADTPKDLGKRFQIAYNGNFYQLDYSGRLNRLIRFLGNPKTINLEYSIGLPGGLGVDENDGISYFFHTKELRHTPHIHAKYQGEEISIEILTLKVRGSYKNRKKQSEAIKYVKNNTSRLLAEYNLKTNGIHILPEYVEKAEITTLHN